VTPEQELLSRVAKTVFHLNGQLLAIAEDLAGPVGLTAARWQVLATVLNEAMTVADIGRELGVTRQSVQRIADILVDQDLAVYRPNPAHQRAKLLYATDEGRKTVGKIRPAHAELAARLAQQLGTDELRCIVDTLQELATALDTIDPSIHSAN
jgi:DNA-binding MarR family transcriptional regulator